MSLFNKSKLEQLEARDTPDPGRRTVMIVDDEEANLRVMSSILSPHYRLVAAHDGREALDLVAQMPDRDNLACIISDQRMPHMTGVELFQKVHKLAPRAMCIIVTGFIDLDTIIDSINKADIYKFVIKPFDAKDFILTAQRAVENFEMKLQLDNYHRDLEEKVKLRTNELALANQYLQKNDERLRQAKQKAEEATQLKSAFLANVSHEIRTPLAGVIGMLSFALRDPHLRQETRDKIELGQANAQSLLTIINDLLDISKIEAGKLRLEKIDFALADHVRNVMGLFEEHAAGKSVGFEFSVALDSALPSFVLGDPTRLRQVLVNLVGNAFKFTESGYVQVGVRLLDRRNGGSLIAFTVQDTGIGIAPEALRRLFQKFEQADTATTRRYGGTGLGLAICRQLVELMGGTIQVHSTPGSGSTFSFVLPMQDGAEPKLQAPSIPTSHSHQLRILCAEDFPTNQIIIRMLLEELNHVVVMVENGAEAVAAAAREHFDAILMDGRMPEMDGVSATRLIRAGGQPSAPVRDRDIAIIGLTANASDEVRQQFLEAGMDDMLAKPIDENALHAILAGVIVKQRERGIALPVMPQLPEAQALLPETTWDAGERRSSKAETHVEADTELRILMHQAFVGEIDKRLAQIDTALAQQDGDTLGRVLHGIKGGASYLDQQALSELCSVLESAADQHHWTVVRASLPRLKQLLAEC